MRYFPLLAAPAWLLGLAAYPLKSPSTTRAFANPVALGPLAAPGAVLADAQRQALLARADLGRLWKHQPQNGADDVLNGCFGYDGRRLEFVFTSVRADAKKPGHYAVAGKFRCYGDVTPFRGRIELQQVQRLPAEVAGYADGEAAKVPTYCATGHFALQATSAHGLGGQFDGRVALDFQLGASRRAVLTEYTANPTTRRGGLLFDGHWRDGADGDAVPALWKQGMAVTRQVLTRFTMGDRSGSINRQYTRVGWNTYWKNEEWWVERQIARR